MTTVDEMVEYGKTLNNKSEELKIKFHITQSMLDDITEQQKALEHSWYEAIDGDNWELYKDLDSPFDRWLPSEYDC